MLIMITLVATAFSTEYSLSGTVTTYYFNQPIDSCRMVLVPVSPTAVADSTMTDKTGKYRFAVVSPGVYDVAARHGQYLEKPTRVMVNGAITTDFSLMLKANVYTDTLPEKLTKAHSPFFLTGDTIRARNLVIDSGVVVCVKGIVVLCCSSIVATGSAAAPVRFIPADTLSMIKPDAKEQHYTYCDYKGTQFFIDEYDHGFVSVDYCTLEANHLTIYARVLNMRNNLIIRKNGSSISADTIMFSRNVLTYSSSEDAITIRRHGSISGNNFMRLYLVLETSGDSVVNNIFQSRLTPVIRADRTVYMAFNCIGVGALSANQMYGLVGIGNISLKNDNGYPCDMFFNILANADVLNDTTGELSPSSPCRKAGYNGIDIGVWQSSRDQTMIARRDSPSRLEISGTNPRHALYAPFLPNRQSAAPGGKAAIYLFNGRRVAVPAGFNSRGNASTSAGRTLSNGVYVLEQWGR
jgi:hypothetical protein